MKKSEIVLALLLSGIVSTAMANPTYQLRFKAKGVVATPSTIAPSQGPLWTVQSSPPTVFANTSVGASAHLSLHIKNTHTAPATLGNLDFSGPNATEFFVSGSTCTAVRPAESCELSLVFEPAAAGVKSASLTIAGAAVQYSGTGLAPVDANTALLMHMNGTSGSSAFPDETGNSVSSIGGMSISGATPKFGNGAASFNGTNQAIILPKEVFNFGSADYTVEAWIRPNSGKSSLQAVIASSWGWQMYWAPSGLSLYISSNPVGPAYGTGPLTAPAGAAPALTWSHVAVVRNSQTLSLYVNGVHMASKAFTGAQVAPVYRASLGAIYDTDGPPSYNFSGQIDEVRVSKGKARYLAPFTPPSQEFTR